MEGDERVQKALQRTIDKIHAAEVDAELLDAVWPAILGQADTSVAIANIRRLADERAKRAMQAGLPTHDSQD